MDPELQKRLDSIRGMVKRSHESPAREWPLVFIAALDGLLVVREWPGGEMTAYILQGESRDVR